MIVKYKSFGSYERRLNRIQLRGEVTTILNQVMDKLYKKGEHFWLKSAEIIVEGSKEDKSGQVIGIATKSIRIDR